MTPETPAEIESRTPAAPAPDDAPPSVPQDLVTYETKSAPPLFLTNLKRTILTLRVLLALAATATAATGGNFNQLAPTLLAPLVLYTLSTLVLAGLKPARFEQVLPVMLIFLFDLAALTMLMIYDTCCAPQLITFFYIIVLLGTFTRSAHMALAISLATGITYVALSIAGVMSEPPFSAAFNTRIAVFSILATFSTYIALELRRSTEVDRETIHRLLESSRDGVLLCDISGRILGVNSEAERLLGRPRQSLAGENQENLFAPAEQDVSTVEAATGPPPENLVTLRDRPGTFELRQDTIRLRRERYLIISIRDVSKAHQLSNTLEHLERLAALGRLIAGLAHQMNNALTIALGYSELLANRVKEQEEKAWAQAASESILRSREILRDFLDMARGRPFHPVETNINKLLDRIETLAAPSVQVASAEFVVRKDPEDSTLWADPLKLEEVILNLIHNALHAMESSPTKRLSLSAERQDPFFRIRLSDTGMGILPHVQERIFEPFFTTKGAKEGSGLGLSICKTLIELHRGSIDVQSTPGRGTTFFITLPLH